METAAILVRNPNNYINVIPHDNIEYAEVLHLLEVHFIWSQRTLKKLFKYQV